MSFLTLAYTFAFYLAFGVLMVGLARKIIQYARIPAPLKIPTTPAPTTLTGVAWRMFKEVVFFTSLFKATKWTWLFGWLFHAGLLVVLLWHLRFFTDPVWGWVVAIEGVGKYATGAMLIGLAGLWLRRLLVDRVRYISAPSDHLMLLLLMGIVTTGALMRTVTPVDVAGLNAFVLGLLYFNWQPLPADGMLVLHLTLVVVLMLVFPFSKLLHAPGVVLQSHPQSGR